MPQIQVSELQGSPTTAQSSFSIATAQEGAFSILAPWGDLDLLTVEHLIGAINEALETGTTDLVIDLTMTEFLGAAGLAALEYGRQRIEAVSGRFAVVASGRSTARPIAILGLQEILNLHHRVADVTGNRGTSTDRFDEISQPI
jgi:anti-sigma B factor antagonist